MEDNTTRVIMIAVGIFVILIVITGIILYVSAARNMATVVDKGLNSWDDITVTNIMDYSGDVSIKCTGMDFVNFLRKNFMRDDIYFTISNAIGMQNKHISWWKAEKTNNVSEIKLAKIDINAAITMKKSTTIDSNGVATYLITIEGDVVSNRDAYVTDSVWKMEKDNAGRYAYVTDGDTLLEIGDTVNYVTAESPGATWKILGAEDGKILLLGDSYKAITPDEWLAFTTGGSSIFDICNEKFEEFDDGIGALKNSARCLNFRDIERFTETDHDTSYSEYGRIYTLSWQSNKKVLVNGSKAINLRDEIFRIFNGKTMKFVRYPDGLSTVVDNCYAEER